MRFVYNDGGRQAAGYKGHAGDCVARAIAIISEHPYVEVYATLAEGMGAERKSRGASARNGIHTTRKWFKDYMRSLGFVWTPTMGIGTGCRVHLTDGELPLGRLIVAVSKHYTAVIDGVIHDTHNPQREGGEVTTWYKPGTTEVDRVTVSGGRCVYGYWQAALSR